MEVKLSNSADTFRTYTAFSIALSEATVDVAAVL